MVQARRSDGAPVFEGPPTGVPHRWQKRAWGDSSARQDTQDRAVRPAPQALQKFPAELAPQTGQEGI